MKNTIAFRAPIVAEIMKPGVVYSAQYLKTLGAGKNSQREDLQGEIDRIVAATIRILQRNPK